MEAEFARIRQQVSGNAFLLNKVEVFDHQPRFVQEDRSNNSSRSSKRSEVSLIQGEHADYFQPVVIEKITVNRKFKKGKKPKKENRNNRSRSSSSEHSYRVYMNSDVLWEGSVKVGDVTFDVKLYKKDFLSYKLVASSEVHTESKMFSHLPFEEEDAKDQFRPNLILEHTDGKITQLDIKGALTGYWPFGSRGRTSKRITFDQVADISARVLYTFRFNQFENQYHVEITKHWSDHKELQVYALRVNDVTDKCHFSIATPFNNTGNGPAREYIEQNLKINWKIGQEGHRMAFLSINYPPNILSYTKWFVPKISWTTSLNGVTYNVGLAQSDL